jgi:ribosome recycling factor
VAQDDVLGDLKTDLEKVITSFRGRLAQMRTGRASISLLDGIRVDYYGTVVPLQQVATLAAPEARLITISPWEKSMLTVIEKEIQKSGLGFNPQNDGKIIRIPIPELSVERRRELIKVLNKEAEASKVSARNTRRDYNDLIKSLEKDKDITEDESHRLQTRVQEITDDYIKKTGDLALAKQKEIEEV